MAALSNTRWELFSLGLSGGKNKRQAYLDAGFNSNNSSGANATTLSKRPEIQARVAELIQNRKEFSGRFVDNTDMEHLQSMDEVAESGIIDRAWIIQQLMENVKVGRESGQLAASNLALKMLGGEIGMFQERRGGNGEATEEKPKEIASPVSVDHINRLLADKGYNGPPIDLTQKQVIKISSG